MSSRASDVSEALPSPSVSLIPAAIEEEEEEIPAVSEGDKDGRDDAAPASDGAGRGAEIWGRVARVNVPERLVLCVEDSEDLRKIMVEGDHGVRVPAVSACLRCLSTFVWLKHRVNPRHSYSLLTTHPLTWAVRLTHDPREVLSFLHPPQQGAEDNTQLYIEDLLETIASCAPAPPPVARDDCVPWAPPPHVTRVVMVTTRHPPPRPQGPSPLAQALLESPYFFMDFLLLTDSEKTKNVVQYSASGWSLSVAPRISEVQEGLAKLVAHPLQRPHHRHAHHRHAHHDAHHDAHHANAVEEASAVVTAEAN